MRVIENSIIPFKGFAAINIFGVLFIRKGVVVTDLMIRHEMIHTKQIKELGYILFYVFYLLEWLLKLPFHGKKVYFNLSFEREAYQNQFDLHYLSNRRCYAFVKHIF